MRVSWRFWGGPLLCGIVLLVFANSFSAGLPLDNRGLILQDSRIRAASAENLSQIFGHSYWWPRGGSGLYRPFTTLTYLFNYTILGDGERASGYHLLNLLLHLLNVLLVYALGLKLIRDFWPSFFVAALWAVHPVLTESVTNIVGRADLLAAAAVLGGFLLYLKGAESSGLRRFLCFAGLSTVTAIGVYSKESAVMIVGIIVLYEILWWRDRRVPLILGCLAAFIPIQVMLYQRSQALRSDPPAIFPFTDNPLVTANFWQAKLTVFKVMAYYLRQAVWPLKLSADYSYRQIPLASGSLQDWLSWIAVVAALFLVLLAYRRDRLIFFMALFAAINFLPASNLFFAFGTIMAERLLYLPLVGVIGGLVLCVFAVASHFHSPRPAPIVLTAVICLFAIRTIVRNADWRDDLSLAQASVQSSPNSFKSHRMLAEALYAADPSQVNLSQVLVEAERSLAILNDVPDNQNTAEIYRFTGDCYIARGDQLGGSSAEAARCYHRALTVLQHGAAILESARASQLTKIRAEGKPDSLLGTTADDDIYRLLAAAYFRTGDGDKAFEAASESRRRTPMNPAVYRQLAHILFAAHETSDAATVLMEGSFVSSDNTLRQDLIDMYRSTSNGQSCAIVNGPYGPAINPNCPMVHRSLCDAGLDAVRIHAAAGHIDAAAGLKRSLLNQYSCPAAPLNEIQIDGPDKP